MNLRGMVWTRWRSVRPERTVYVYGMYEGEPERVYRGMTCKHNCCWDCGHGSMVLPEWWSPCDDQTSELTGISIPAPTSSPEATK